MALTRLQMVNEVLDNLSRTGTSITRSGTTLADRVVIWLNRAQTYIFRDYDMLFSRSTTSTVASQQTYSFPSNVNSIYSITIQNGTNSWKLTCVMPWEFDRKVANPSSDSTAQPVWYIPFKTTGEFELYPIPDAVYTLNLRYSVIPTALATDSSITDYSVLGIDVDDVLIKYATSEGYKWLQELVDSAKWEADARSSIKKVYDNVVDTYPDWTPIGNGFRENSNLSITGEYWNNPFIERIN